MAVSEKYSIASKKKWERVPKEERRRIMAERAKQKWAKMPLKDKARHIKKMVDARRSKKKI